MNSAARRKLDMVATSAAIGSVCCWSIGPIFIKLLTGYVDLWTQNLLRYSVACLFWLPLLVFFVKTNRVDKSIWRKALVPAVLNIIMQCFWAGAFYHINPAFMNLLTKSAIIWITILSLLFFADERVLVKSPRFWLAMGFCLTGVIGVLYFKTDFTTAGTSTGVAMALAAAFLWGLYTVSARATFRNVDSRVGFAVVTVYTVAALLVLAIVFGNVGECLKMGVRPWVYVVVSGLTAIAFSHVLFYTALKRIGAMIPSLILLSTPFVILTISRLVFGETLTVLQWVFGMVLLSGAGLAVWSQQKLRADTK